MMDQTLSSHHGSILSVLGPHMTQVTTEVASFSNILQYVKYISATLQSASNLEEFSFPDHVHFDGENAPWNLYHDLELEEEDVSVFEYLNAHPLPKLTKLRKLRIGCIPSHILRTVLDAYVSELISLEMETSFLPRFPKKFPKLKQLTLQVTSSKNACYYLNKVMNSAPLEKLCLIEVTSGHEPRLIRAIPSCLTYIHGFGNTLKHLELAFSGNVMWDKHSFPTVDLPVLKTLKLEHCSTVDLEQYSGFLFSLTSLQSLTVDKAHCAHRKYGNCSWKNMPVDCESVGCQYRADIEESGLWNRLPHLKQFSFRGCGMIYIEALSRDSLNKMSSEKMFTTNFMEVFTIRGSTFDVSEFYTGSESSDCHSFVIDDCKQSENIVDFFGSEKDLKEEIDETKKSKLLKASVGSKLQKFLCGLKRLVNK